MITVATTGYIKHARASINISERAVYFPAEIQLEIANESDLRSLHSTALVTPFRSSVFSGRNSITVDHRAHTVPNVRSQVRTRSASECTAADRLCTVASFPTIKLRQVSALAACVGRGRIFIVALTPTTIKRAARYAFI